MIRIGTSGFSFQDWIGIVYPENIKKKDMLEYYVKELNFNTLEINFTYYTMPYKRTMEGMEKKTNDNFEFVVKFHKDMTHDIYDENLRIKDNREIFSYFLEGVEPLRKKNKLGALLAQFPYSFYPNEKNKEYISLCKERVEDIPLVVEFRNSSWVNEDTFKLLEDLKLSFCCVDEPKIKGLMPFISRVTSSLGYIRFHGRNKDWFNASPSERYNYFYTDKELEELIPLIKKIEEDSEKCFLFFNNCHCGAAALNAKKMISLLA
jgi:uncharacterized protein YecE (DUF72 family)